MITRVERVMMLVQHDRVLVVTPNEILAFECGESFHGLSYQALRDLGTGEHQLSLDKSIPNVVRAVSRAEPDACRDPQELLDAVVFLFNSGGMPKAMFGLGLLMVLGYHAEAMDKVGPLLGGQEIEVLSAIVDEAPSNEEDVSEWLRIWYGSSRPDIVWAGFLAFRRYFRRDALPPAEPGGV